MSIVVNIIIILIGFAIAGVAAKQFMITLKPEGERLERLHAHCVRRFERSGRGPLHGPGHWDRVAVFGRMLCAESEGKVDLDVVLAFAIMHDACRRNDEEDPGHGDRAASLVLRWRHSRLGWLNEEQIFLLAQACALHTDTVRTGNPTVDACFDADRMDLPRAGIVPDPERMASSRGAAFAREGYGQYWNN